MLRQEVLKKALSTLEKSVNKLEHKQFTDYQELRDSMIQRFEYSTDTFWKYLKDYLLTILAIEVEFARPKAVLKACYDAKLISSNEFDVCINIIEDRNLTSHGYNEEIAEEISRHIPEYFLVMRSIVERLHTTLNR